jgi:hypothetical protein
MSYIVIGKLGTLKYSFFDELRLAKGDKDVFTNYKTRDEQNGLD